MSVCAVCQCLSQFMSVFVYVCVPLASVFESVYKLNQYVLRMCALVCVCVRVCVCLRACCTRARKKGERERKNENVCVRVLL